MNPREDWRSFASYNAGLDCKRLRNEIFDTQGGLCAYCETDGTKKSDLERRVEHFHPKSDTTAGGKNWHLDWENIFGVCKGGEQSDKSLHPLPRNLSCDAYKNHATLSDQALMNPEGHILNPLIIPVFPCLFLLDKGTGELLANEDACMDVLIEGNKFDSTHELVLSTIRILNLNCDRLMEQRRLVVKQYNIEVAKGRKRNDKDIHNTISERWFGYRWPSFFTTRLILLGGASERYLTRILYTG